MFNQNPNPRLTKRRTVVFMIALTILAWATQTLFHQWGFGAEPAAEKFIESATAARGATLELRAEASIVGSEVRLKQVCRWSDADNAAIAPISELVLMRFTQNQPFRSIGIEELKKISGVRDVTTNREDDWNVFSLRVESGLDVREEIFKLAAARHWTLRELSQRRATLEDVFVEITHSDQVGLE